MDARTKIRILKPLTIILLLAAIGCLASMYAFIAMDVTSGRIGSKSDEVTACFATGILLITVDVPLALHMDYLENQE